MREVTETPDVDAPQVPVEEPDTEENDDNDNDNDNDENGENDTPAARYDGGAIPTS